jgi:hypothetical protein
LTTDYDLRKGRGRVTEPIADSRRSKFITEVDRRLADDGESGGEEEIMEAELQEQYDREGRMKDRSGSWTSRLASIPAG